MDGISTALIVVFALLGVGYILLNASGPGTTIGSALGIPSSGDDFIDQLANGIAKAEGYYVPLSRASKNNNPGNITDRNIGGVVATGADYGGLSIFASPQDGWTALYAKLRNIINGGSTTFPLSFTIYQLAWTWTGGDAANTPGSTQGWADTVSSTLSSAGYHVTSGSTLEEINV